MYQNCIVIFAGAGISEESGLATFRSNNGLWEQYDVMKICDLNRFYADHANSDFQARQDVFDFYNMRKRDIQNAMPNYAHLKIAEWQKSFGSDRVIIVTSNIDDLFEKAGCVDVVHVHGHTEGQKCLMCGTEWHIGQEEFDSSEPCPDCGSNFTKPSVIFFGENAPEYQTMEQIYSNVRENDFLFYIGSSMNVIHPSRLFRQRSWGGPIPNTMKILVDTNANVLADACGTKFDIVMNDSSTKALSKLDFYVNPENQLRIKTAL